MVQGNEVGEKWAYLMVSIVDVCVYWFEDVCNLLGGLIEFVSVVEV